jgi:flagellar motor component MotA
MNHEEFVKEYYGIVERALFLSDKSRREGLLALEELIDENKIDIMNIGLRLIVDGTDKYYVDKILSNIVDLEPDSEKKLLKKIKKEAILEIQCGTNPRLFALLLNSYVTIGNEDAIKKYNDI